MERKRSEAGSYSRLIDFVYHSTLGLRVIKKKKKKERKRETIDFAFDGRDRRGRGYFFFFITLKPRVE